MYFISKCGWINSRRHHPKSIWDKHYQTFIIDSGKLLEIVRGSKQKHFSIWKADKLSALFAEAQLSGISLFLSPSHMSPLDIIVSYTENMTYLFFSMQGLFSPSSHISMCLAGTEIPGWFNYQSPGSSLEIHLPPYWWATKWMGFAFCIEFGFQEPLPDSSTISCDLHACITPNQDLFLGHTAVEISKDMIVTSDQLWFNYMPRSSLTCLDLWEACCHLKVTFSSNHLRVKYCGLRAIYGRDLDDLVTCSNPFQNLGLPCNDNVEKSKRSRDEYSCGSGREPDESGSLPAKRLRMAVDPES